MDIRKILPIAIIGVALLALVAYAISSRPATTSLGGQAGIPGQSAPGQNPQAPQQTAQPPLSSEPVSSEEPATLVPEDTDLKQYCEKYYSAWENSDWKTAYEMQPLAKKQQGDVDAFSKQLQGYGMSDYEVGEPQINGNAGTVTVKLTFGGGIIMATHWSFVKNDKGQWTVQDSKTGMN